MTKNITINQYLLQRSGSSVSSTPCLSRDNSRAAATTIQHHSMLVQTSFDQGAAQGNYSSLVMVTTVSVKRLVLSEFRY